METLKVGLDEGDEFLTLKEAAAGVRKSPRTLYRWIQDGTLQQVYKIGGRTLVSKSAVLSLVRPHPLTKLRNY